MWKKSIDTSPKRDEIIVNHTVETIADLTQFDTTIDYSNNRVKIILDTALYMLLEKMKDYLDNQPKAKKKKIKIRKSISEIMATLRKRKTVQTTQKDVSEEVRTLINWVDLEWKEFFANLFIITKDYPNWKRLISFRKSDFKNDFDPLEAMKKAIKEFN